MATAVAGHGTLGLSTPWARAAFPNPEVRREIAAAIPAGYTIGVSGHAHGRGKVFVLWALGPGLDESGRPPELLRWPGRHDPQNAARAIARRLQDIAAQPAAS